MRPSEVKDTWCQTAAVVCSALTLVCKQALEGRLKLKEQCIVIFPSLAHKTLLFVMPIQQAQGDPWIWRSADKYIYLYICIYIYMYIYTYLYIYKQMHMCMWQGRESDGFRLPTSARKAARTSKCNLCNEILRWGEAARAHVHKKSRRI